MSPLSRTVAHAVSNYASQAGLTMDALRDDAGAHAGNLRAELMQTTGNTQLFTNQFVTEMLGGLTGGAPNVDAIDKVVGGVIASQEARMQQVNAGMGATLNASQSMGTGQRDISTSPMMTQAAFMSANNANANAGRDQGVQAGGGIQPQDLTNAGADAGVQNHLDQSGAAIGMQGASWGSKVLKRIRTGAIVLGLSAAAVTGFMGFNHMQNTPDFDQNRAPIELIQEQQAPSQNFEVVTPAPAQQDDGAFGPGAGQVENDKEAVHQQMLQNGGATNGANNGAPATNPPADNNPPANDASPPAAENDKEQAHEATYGTTSVNNGGGGGSSVTHAPAGGNEGVVTGSDEGVRSGGPTQDLGPQDVSRNK